MKEAYYYTWTTTLFKYSPRDLLKALILPRCIFNYFSVYFRQYRSHNVTAIGSDFFKILRIVGDPLYSPIERNPKVVSSSSLMIAVDITKFRNNSSWNFSCKNARLACGVWLMAPSCWNHMFSRSLFSIYLWNNT